MKKSILNIQGVKEISKNSQKSINGGCPTGCPTGCFDLFIGSGEGNACGILTHANCPGQGIIRNGQCCL
ncbi:hypothetical protein GTQ40_07150 [Flavobacteriaceae bacterium R38]|nr:hypothetical protein [Flavobacteriaceae bacterium R38]